MNVIDLTEEEIPIGAHISADVIDLDEECADDDNIDETLEDNVVVLLDNDDDDEKSQNETLDQSRSIQAQGRRRRRHVDVNSDDHDDHGIPTANTENDERLQNNIPSRQRIVSNASNNLMPSNLVDLVSVAEDNHADPEQEEELKTAKRKTKSNLKRGTMDTHKIAARRSKLTGETYQRSSPLGNHASPTSNNPSDALDRREYDPRRTPPQQQLAHVPNYKLPPQPQHPTTSTVALPYHAQSQEPNRRYDSDDKASLNSKSKYADHIHNNTDHDDPRSLMELYHAMSSKRQRRGKYQEAKQFKYTSPGTERAKSYNDGSNLCHDDQELRYHGEKHRSTQSPNPHSGHKRQRESRGAPRPSPEPMASLREKVVSHYDNKATLSNRNWTEPAATELLAKRNSSRPKQERKAVKKAKACANNQQQHEERATGGDSERTTVLCNEHEQAVRGQHQPPYLMKQQSNRSDSKSNTVKISQSSDSAASFPEPLIGLTDMEKFEDHCNVQSQDPEMNEKSPLLSAEPTAIHLLQQDSKPASENRDSSQFILATTASFQRAKSIHNGDDYRNIRSACLGPSIEQNQHLTFEQGRNQAKQSKIFQTPNDASTGGIAESSSQATNLQEDAVHKSNDTNTCDLHNQTGQVNQSYPVSRSSFSRAKTRDDDARKPSQPNFVDLSSEEPCGKNINTMLHVTTNREKLPPQSNDKRKSSPSRSLLRENQPFQSVEPTAGEAIENMTPMAKHGVTSGNEPFARKRSSGDDKVGGQCFRWTFYDTSTSVRNNDSGCKIVAESVKAKKREVQGSVSNEISGPQGTEAGKRQGPLRRGKRFIPDEVSARFFKRNRDYNFSISEQDACELQERLIREAAARVRSQNALPYVQTCAEREFVEPVLDIALNYPDHWNWNNPYSRLGLPPGAPLSLIKLHYRKLALKYHPDKCSLADASNRFQSVTGAYQLLTRPGT